MECFILDTSIFTTTEVYSQFADDGVAAIETFLNLARQADAQFYMPGSAYAELCQMRDLGGIAAEFESVVRIRSPRRFDLQLPADVLYEFIDEVRARIDRGLRVAEEHARMVHGGDNRQDVGQVIGRLRERYRETLRRGIIDSREDVDVLLLAYELDGILLAADEGLRKWADKVGVRLIAPAHLRHAMVSAASRTAAPPAADD